MEILSKLRITSNKFRISNQDLICDVIIPFDQNLLHLYKHFYYIILYYAE